MIALSPTARRVFRLALHRRSSEAMALGLFAAIGDDDLDAAARSQIAQTGHRIAACARSQTWRVTTPEGDATRIEFSNQRACKSRLCPSCESRRCRMLQRRLHLIIDEVFREQPETQAVLVTLTTRNRPLSALQPMLREHQAALAWFWRRKRLQDVSLGVFSAMELAIRGSREAPEAGLHSHSMMLVPPGYFTAAGPAIHQSEYRDLWRRSARLAYDPVVDVRRVRGPDGETDAEGVHFALREVAKYSLSVADILHHSGDGGISVDGDIAATILSAFHRQRLHRFDRIFASAAQRLRQRQEI